MNVLIFVQSILATALLIIDTVAWAQIHLGGALIWLGLIGAVWYAASRDFYIWNLSSR